MHIDICKAYIMFYCILLEQLSCALWRTTLLLKQYRGNTLYF